MLVVRSTLAWHTQAIRRCLEALHGTASMDLSDLSLEIRVAERRVRFLPQFLVVESDGFHFELSPPAEGGGFAGWRPYSPKHWPAAARKLAFKDFCISRQLPTPRFSSTSPVGLGSYVVKGDKSSFARGMRGPFRAGVNPVDSARPEGVIYEQYVSGRMFKASYWDAELLCLEMQEPAAVTGDGSHTIRELIAANLLPSPPSPRWDLYSDMVAYHGEHLDAVLGQGRSLVVDCLFGSRLTPTRDIYANVLEELRGGPIVRQLIEWGPQFVDAIPREMRDIGTLYTVDGVADQNGQVWLLEMNCNPQVHPDVYPGMLNAIFGAQDAAPGDHSAGHEPPASAELTPGEALALVELEVANGRLEEGLRKVKTLIEGPRALTEALPLAARIYASLRLMQNAQECYRMYLAERPHADLEAFELGMTHFQSGDREQARQQWRALLERSPRYVPALYFSGLVEAQEGRAEDARRYLDALLRCAPAADPYAARGARLLNDIEAFASRSGPEVSPPGRSGWVPADHPAGRQG
jgi:hypothetical protein